MSILKTLIDQLTTPSINIDANKSISQALLVEYAKEQDDVATLLAKSNRRVYVNSPTVDISKQAPVDRAETQTRAKTTTTRQLHPK